MKRIAFIKDGAVLLVLNCDQKLFDGIMSADAEIDATGADQGIALGWTYDGTTFTAPVTAGE